ncbi:hypothetical protein KQX54_016173 [Cotesia glomerata]|uniref:Uncharacterized protein n=1 Tax=Cotesia glomerata TaxID=32391 RepID=A0AAV7IPV2_COTGL|nr:hypothetical protein KQX54_016173 [Cotesia glomerata]
MYKIRLYVVPEEESEDNNNNNKNNEDDDDNVIPIMQRKNSRRATTGAIRVNVISKNRKSKKLKLKDDQVVSIDVKHKNKLNGYKTSDFINRNRNRQQVLPNRLTFSLSRQNRSRCFLTPEDLPARRLSSFVPYGFEPDPEMVPLPAVKPRDGDENRSATLLMFGVSSYSLVSPETCRANENK